MRFGFGDVCATMGLAHYAMPTQTSSNSKILSSRRATLPNGLSVVRVRRGSPPPPARIVTQPSSCGRRKNAESKVPPLSQQDFTACALFSALLNASREKHTLVDGALDVAGSVPEGFGGSEGGNLLVCHAGQVICASIRHLTTPRAFYGVPPRHREGYRGAPYTTIPHSWSRCTVGVGGALVWSSSTLDLPNTFRIL